MKKKKSTKKERIYLAIIIVLSVVILAAAAYLVWAHITGDPIDYYQQKCDAFALENANFARGQIVFVGDSITDGCTLDVYYPGLPLATYNRGIGGDSTTGVLRRLQASLIDLQPSKIVLMIGINDINSGALTSTILSNYDSILAQIKKELPNTEVYCVSILPINTDLESYTLINVEKSTERIQKINPEIEKLATKYGYTFIDMFDEFADENHHLYRDLSGDGIHLNDAGYRKYSARLLPYLNRAD